MTNMLKKYYGLQDARGLRGIMARGNAKYAGPAKAPKPGNMLNVQKAARLKLKKMQDKRKTGR